MCKPTGDEERGPGQMSRVARKRNTAAAVVMSLVLSNWAWGAADLSSVPQISETKEQRDERMQWFRDAKFGLFVHWGPASVAGKEISWGRDAERPQDIRDGKKPSDLPHRYAPDFYIPDDVYDNLYTQFNPVEFDAEKWVQIARDAGMNYIVFTAKHHDGFSNFHTKYSDYSIANSPFKRDIVKELADACRKHGMKFGLYYSTRDWYHPDYLVGDNVKYDTFYRAQIEELLSRYGDVDIVWFDHVGGRDWSKWKFDELFSMMYRLQPDLVVNNRAARFCGPRQPGIAVRPRLRSRRRPGATTRPLRGGLARWISPRTGNTASMSVKDGPTAARRDSRGRRSASGCRIHAK